MLLTKQTIEVEQRPCLVLLACLPQGDGLHRERAALARLPCQQIVARLERRAWLPPVEIGMNVARFPHLERGVENVHSERRRLPVRHHGLVEPTLGIEDVAEGEARLGILGLDGEHLAEGACGLVEIALGVMDQSDTEHGAGMVGAERGGPAQGLGGAVEVPLGP